MVRHFTTKSEPRKKTDFYNNSQENLVLEIYWYLLLLPVINFSSAQLLSCLIRAKLCPRTNILLCLRRQG